MKTNINLISLLGLSLTLVVAVVGEIVLRLTHIDMTDLRLFITFWWFYVPVIVLFLVFGIIFKITE